MMDLKKTTLEKLLEIEVEAQREYRFAFNVHRSDPSEKNKKLMDVLEQNHLRIVNEIDDREFDKGEPEY